MYFAISYILSVAAGADTGNCKHSAQRHVKRRRHRSVRAESDSMHADSAKFPAAS
jgi:hypothetical protein